MAEMEKNAGLCEELERRRKREEREDAHLESASAGKRRLEHRLEQRDAQAGGEEQAVGILHIRRGGGEGRGPRVVRCRGGPSS